MFNGGNGPTRIVSCYLFNYMLPQAFCLQQRVSSQALSALDMNDEITVQMSIKDEIIRYK